MSKSYEQNFPTLESAETHLAALMVEAVMGDGNTDLLPDGEPCTCGVGDEDDIIRGKLRPRIHHTGCAGRPEKSAALRAPAPVIEWHERYRRELIAFPVLRKLLIAKPKDGVDAVYDWADLKPAEATALAMHHAGFQLGPIADLLKRQETAVRQLIQNGAWKLDRALRLIGPLETEAHCEICQQARDLLLRGLRPQARTA